MCWCLGEASRSSDDGSCHTAGLEDLDMSNATFVSPGLTAFTYLDELGLEVVGQNVQALRTMLACRVVDPDDWCHRCGCQGTLVWHGGTPASARTLRVATNHIADQGAALLL